MVHVNYISLVNLVMEKNTVVELIQGRLTKDNLSLELNRIMKDSNVRDSMRKDYDLLREKLGGQGASQRAARLMMQYLKKK
jgi:lipid-A-disaccharide synthase